MIIPSTCLAHSRCLINVWQSSHHRLSCAFSKPSCCSPGVHVGTVSRSICTVPVILESPQFPFRMGSLSVCQQKSSLQDKTCPSHAWAYTCSTFFSACCFCVFFFLGVFVQFGFGSIFETFASRVLALEVLNHFVLPWLHRARWSPYCGCFCVERRQATVMERSQQEIFIRFWSVSSMGR